MNIRLDFKPKYNVVYVEKKYNALFSFLRYDAIINKFQSTMFFKKL